MMIGERTPLNPTIQIPPWDPLDDPTLLISTSSNDAADTFFVSSSTAPYRFLPSNETDDSDVPVDAFSCDHFRMFEFKIRKCARGRSHDWTECPYAHPSEKARRRDPRKYHYSGAACPDFRKGSCMKGDSCEFAHGVFECWLHPARYRTQLCKDGSGCRRRICFFAHSMDELRVLPQQSPMGYTSSESFEGSPSRNQFDSLIIKGILVSSPKSVLTSPPISPSSGSPPVSPNCPQLGGGYFNSASIKVMRNLQLGKSKMSPQWGMQKGNGFGSALPPGFHSTPSTRTQSGLNGFEIWDRTCVEEFVMERVESGKDLRAQMYARLSNQNLLNRVGFSESDPDVGWVSELIGGL